MARKKSARGWALVKGRGAGGLDEKVVSTHKTKEAAEAAMRKKGYEPTSIFKGGYRIVDVGPTGNYEVIEVFGQKTVRPRSNNPMGPNTNTRKLKNKLLK